MKNLAVLVLTAAVIAGAGIALSGCEEESTNTSSTDTSTMRRARLVADENIELKKQLADKDKEIEKQKQLVDDCKQETTKARDESSATMLQMLQHLATSGKEVETLTQENKELKGRIAELEAKLAQGTSKP